MVATKPTATVLVVLGAILVLLVAALAPPRLATWLVAAATLVAPTSWPFLGSPAGVDLYVGDVLLLTAVTVIALRHKRHVGGYLWAVLLALTFLAVVHADTAGIPSFGRIVAPLWLGLGLASILPARHDVWRDARWWCLALLASIPLSVVWRSHGGAVGSADPMRRR